MDDNVNPPRDATPMDDVSVSGMAPMTPGEEAASYAAGSSPSDEAAASKSRRSGSFFGRKKDDGDKTGEERDDSDSGDRGSAGGGLPPGGIGFSGEDGRPRYRLAHWLLLVLAAAAYCAFVIPQWGEAYIDFGDGNYMYIASRIAEGGVVYRDILAPQPPMHLFTGAGLVKLYEAVKPSLPGEWQKDHPILAFRAFSLLLHLATFLLVVRLGGRAWGRGGAGVAAGMVYLALPLTLWWSMGYQSEPLEVFFLVAMMNCALGGGRTGNALTGIFGGLAAMTNATAAPFLLVLILYMGIANWRRAIRVSVPALLLAGAMTLVMEFYSSGHFLRNVVLNQTGTYPPEGFVDYALGKLRREGTDIFNREGLFIIVAVLGLFRFVRRSPLNGEARGGLAWFSLATFASFLYVTKGGTVDYIFSLAGPAVAIMGAGLWVEVLSFRGDGGEGDWGRPGEAAGGHRPLRRRWLESGVPRLAGAGFLALLLLPTWYFYDDLRTQRAFELPDLDHAAKLSEGSPGSNVEQVAFWIEKYSRPGDTILAPPFYAVLTGRRIWGDYSEIFIWTIKDHNDRTANDAEGEGYRKTLALADAIRNRELPIVIIELDQTGRLPEVITALSEAYRPLLEEPYRTLNTRLGIFVPQDGATGSAGSGRRGPAAAVHRETAPPAVSSPPAERRASTPPVTAEPIEESSAPPVVENSATSSTEAPVIEPLDDATLLLGEQIEENGEGTFEDDGASTPTINVGAITPQPATESDASTSTVTNETPEN